MNKPTRIAITAILAAALALPVIAQATRFPDVPATHFRQADIEAVASRGWFIGKSDGTYDPEGAITSGQMALVIGRRFPNGMTRAEFASLLLVANQWAQNGKPIFTGSPATTTTRPAPTTTTTRPAPTTTTTRPAPTTTESASIAERIAEREAFNALLDSPLWSASPTDAFGWSVIRINTIGDAALEDVREMIAEAKRIDENWATRDTESAMDRMWDWWEEVKDNYEDHRTQRPELEEIIDSFSFRSELQWLHAWD